MSSTPLTLILSVLLDIKESGCCLLPLRRSFEIGSHSSSSYLHILENSHASLSYKVVCFRLIFSLSLSFCSLLSIFFSRLAPPIYLYLFILYSVSSIFFSGHALFFLASRKIKPFKKKNYYPLIIFILLFCLIFLFIFQFH